MRTEDEVRLYVEHLAGVHERVTLALDELGRLGLLPALSAARSETIGRLVQRARSLHQQVSEERDGAVCIAAKLREMDRALDALEEAQQRVSETIADCSAQEGANSERLDHALESLESLGPELAEQWRRLMSVRHQLHTLPVALVPGATIAPVPTERRVSKLQDDHTELDATRLKWLERLRGLRTIWFAYTSKLDEVRRSKAKAEYVMELLRVQDKRLDYSRLVTATQRLQVSLTIIQF